MVTSPLLYIPLTATQLTHIRKTTRQDNDMPRRLGNKRCSICDRHSYALMPNSCILFVSFSHTTLPHQDFPIVSVFLCGLWQMGMKWKCSLAFFCLSCRKVRFLTACKVTRYEFSTCSISFWLLSFRCSVPSFLHHTFGSFVHFCSLFLSVFVWLLFEHVCLGSVISGESRLVGYRV